MLKEVMQRGCAVAMRWGRQLVGLCLVLLMSSGFVVSAATPVESSLSTSTELGEPVTEIPVVNINEADAITIAKRLIGVGMRRAEAIVEYRETYGPFYSAEELKVVKGIGRATVERNRDRIRIK